MEPITQTANETTPAKPVRLSRVQIMEGVTRLQKIGKLDPAHRLLLEILETGDPATIATATNTLLLTRGAAE